MTVPTGYANLTTVVVTVSSTVPYTKTMVITFVFHSYEFEVANQLNENKIKWERPTYFIWEDDNGIKHRYYPDFYLPEYNVYLDPKNDYLINNKSKKFGITDVEKIMKVEQQNGIRIIILDKDNLTWENIKQKI